MIPHKCIWILSTLKEGVLEDLNRDVLRRTPNGHKDQQEFRLFSRTLKGFEYKQSGTKPLGRSRSILSRSRSASLTVCWPTWKS